MRGKYYQSSTSISNSLVLWSLLWAYQYHCNIWEPPALLEIHRSHHRQRIPEMHRCDRARSPSAAVWCFRSCRPATTEPCSFQPFRFRQTLNPLCVHDVMIVPGHGIWGDSPVGWGCRSGCIPLVDITFHVSCKSISLFPVLRLIDVPSDQLKSRTGNSLTKTWKPTALSRVDFTFSFV